MLWAVLIFFSRIVASYNYYAVCGCVACKAKVMRKWLCIAKRLVCEELKVQLVVKRYTL